MGTRTDQEITKVAAPVGAPDYLAMYTEADESLAAIKEYRTVSRIKVVQSLSGDEFKKSFDEGDIIVHPGGILLSHCDKKTKTGPMFKLVPVFPFTEFCVWSDRRDKTSPMIQERTFDKASTIAQKAKSDKARFEIYGDPKAEKPLKKRYVEHLNFISYVYGDDNPDKGLLVGLSYSRGEFTRGTRFCTDLATRKKPTWCQVWGFKPAFRDFGDKKWYGLDHCRPTEDEPFNAFIKEEEVKFFHDAYEEFKQLFAKRQLGVVLEEEDDEEAIPQVNAQM